MSSWIGRSCTGCEGSLNRKVCAISVNVLPRAPSAVMASALVIEYGENQRFWPLLRELLASRP
jgi:hypothetical protein